jgi:hypothetical protein
MYKLKSNLTLGYLSESGQVRERREDDDPQ